jgi:hypothetical protein
MDGKIADMIISVLLSFETDLELSHTQSKRLTDWQFDRSLMDEIDLGVLEAWNDGIEIYSVQFPWDEFRWKDVHHDLILYIVMI